MRKYPEGKPVVLEWGGIELASPDVNDKVVGEGICQRGFGAIIQLGVDEKDTDMFLSVLDTLHAR